MPCKLCGTQCERGRYFIHLKESHPQHFIKHQRNAIFRLNEKYPTLHKEVMAKILKSNPNHQREAFAKLLEEFPNHQSEAGRLGGKIGGYLGGNITGPKTIWKALEWKKEHPERAWKQFKICQEAGRKWRREHPIEVAGYLRKARKAAIES